MASFAGMGRRMPRIAVAAVLAVALAAALGATVTSTDQPFTVVETGPTGTVPHENLEGGIWVLFSSPVVPLKTLEKAATSSPIFTITPDIPGTYRWYGSRLLSLEPTGQLQPATEYVLKVAPSVRSLDGVALSGPTEFRFRTEPLSLVSVNPSGEDVPTKDAREIELAFNFPVDLDTISPSIRVEAGGRSLPFQAGRPRITRREQLGPYENADRLVTLTLTREPPRDQDVTVRVLSGARPQPGSFGSAQELAATFHTLLPLSLEESEASSQGSRVMVSLRFNHPLKEDSFASNVRLDRGGYSAQDHAEVSGSWAYLYQVPVPFESRFSIRLLAGVQDQYGQTLGKDRVVPLEVGPAESYVSFHGTGQRLLESQFPPVIAVEMQNIQSGSYGLGRLSDPFARTPPAPTTSINTRAIPRNQRYFQFFDLSRLLNKDGKGAAYLSWKFRGLFYGSESPQEIDDNLVVQVTDIGASVHLGNNALVVAASSLSSGQPIADAEVGLRDDGATLATGRTESTGVAIVPLPAGLVWKSFQGDGEKAEVVVAKGSDRIVVRPSTMQPLSWNRDEPFAADRPRPLTYLWSDRGIYRPGETVSFAGIDRDLALGKLKAVSGGFRVDLMDASQDSDSSRPLASTLGTASSSGSFSGSIALPPDIAPGQWVLQYNRTGAAKADQTGQAWIQVAAFRRVALAVDLKVDKDRAFMGDSLDARIVGNYLAGGTVTKGTFNWFWSRREIWYHPPGDALADYAFGDEQKGWAEELGSDAGALAVDGVTIAAQSLQDADPGRVYSYEVEATVQDVDRQAVSGRGAATVFASQQLLGAKITSGVSSDDSLYFVKKGEPFTVKVVSVDPDGAPYPGGVVRGKLTREEWLPIREAGVGGYVDTHYERQLTVEQTFTVAPGQPFGSAQIATQKAGSYLVELSGQDTAGRPSYTRLSFYSTGADVVRWQSYDERRIELVPDKKVYAPGDRARILVKSPLASGSYLVTVEREGISEQRLVNLTGSASTIDVDVKEEHVPIVYVSVSTAIGRTAPPASGPDAPDFGKPRGYSGLVELPVRTGTRSITVDFAGMSGSYRPGSKVSLTLKATAIGRPVAGAEIALVAADRGVLDLIDYHVPGPIDFFYSGIYYPDRVAHYDTRDLLLDPVTWKQAYLPGGDEKGEAALEVGGEPQVRKDFRATAVFRTGLVTGSDGSVAVSFTLPDQLTRFRLTAVAVKDDRFGIGESELLVQNPINVRAALPRRLRVGDRASAGVVLTNLDASARTVSVELQAALLQIDGAARKSVTLKPGETAEVPFDLAAPAEGGAHLTFRIRSDILSEDLEETLAVASEPVTETVTIVGKTTGTAREGIAVPSSFLGVPEEGLSLTLDSTIASALVGAVRYLEVYPYDCLEQVTSKMFARVLFPSLPGAGKADLADIARFANADGGFSYWPDANPRYSNYYVSLRVAHLLAIAQDRGMDIPEGINAPALLYYLSTGWQGQDTYLKSYALYVLSLWGRKEPAMARQLAALGDRLGVFGYGFLGLAYDAMGDGSSAQSVLTRLKSFVRPGTRTVTLVGTVSDWHWYGGDLQAKSLLLMLYARLQPDSQLVLGLANDLLLGNRAGSWGNTSNAGWVLQAFAELIAAGGEEKADFTASVRLGTAVVASRPFQGLSTSPYTTRLDAGKLGDTAAAQQGQAVDGGKLLPLTFGVDGSGTLYYTAEMRYALATDQVDARDEGLGMGVDLRDETGAPVEGTNLSLGKVYQMRIVFYSSQDRTYLAIRAPIPSGAEPIDGSLVTSQAPRPAAQNGSGQGGSEQKTAVEDYGYTGPSTRIYDSEVRFFFDRLPRGKHVVSFNLRATTPGTFPTPPVQAELMYQPEVFGRTSGTVYTISGE